MRQQIFSLVIIVLVFGLQSCENNYAEGEKAIQSYVAAADSISVTPESDLSDLNSDTRKVIRKADIRCRVQHVQDAVARLETFTALAGGFVAESHTRNQVLNERSSTYKSDSLKTVKVYQATANLLIRIPAYALDTLATEVTAIASFIDHRDVTRDDVTLQFLSNLLKNRASEATGSITKGSKATPKETLAVTQYKDNNESRQVDRRIANLGILDDTRYATLSLELYQPEQVTILVTQNVDKLVAETYGDKIVNALGFSIDIIKGFILAIISFWPLWAAIAILFLLFKRAKRRKSAAVVTS